MKKYRKFFIIFIVLLVTGLLAWIIVWSCQANYNRDYYLSLLRYHWSSEMTSFIKENERKIKNPASQMANNEFNSFCRLDTLFGLIKVFITLYY
ncbi:hypothetical protein SIXOD_v1c26610 [Spiroplasma ixodetis Y32]|nr:hypothetical protein SIXOD_v1c26610 [Spiroplasma ixodetis Y32]